MKELLIIISSTLIPALITLITVVFKLYTKYRKEIILATNDVKKIQELITKLNFEIETLKKERDELLQENTALKERISHLEEIINKKAS